MIENKLLFNKLGEFIILYFFPKGIYSTIIPFVKVFTGEGLGLFNPIFGVDFVEIFRFETN